MAIKLNDHFIVLLRNPVNRKQKRQAQKEYEKVMKYAGTVVYAYLDTEEKTDSLRLFAKEQYIKNVKIANEGNVFVRADANFFNDHFPTEEKIKEIISPSSNAKISALIIFLIIVVIILSAIIF